MGEGDKLVVEDEAVRALMFMSDVGCEEGDTVVPPVVLPDEVDSEGPNDTISVGRISGSDIEDPSPPRTV